MTAIATARYYQKQLKALGYEADVLTGTRLRNYGAPRSVKAVLVCCDAQSYCMGMTCITEGCVTAPQPLVKRLDGGAFFEYNDDVTIYFYKDFA